MLLIGYYIISNNREFLRNALSLPLESFVAYKDQAQNPIALI